MQEELTQAQTERDEYRAERNVVLHDIAVANLELSKVKAEHTKVVDMLASVAAWTNLLEETPPDYRSWMAQASEVVIQKQREARELKGERKELRDQVVQLEAALQAERLKSAKLERQLADLKATMGEG